MKKNLLLSILSFVMFAFVANAQNDKLWKPISVSEVSELSRSSKRQDFPADFKLFQLQSDDLQKNLTKLVLPGNNETTTTIELPNTNGNTERFVVYESSNFTPELQAMYPQIRSYVGVGLDDKKASVHISLDPRGIQVMVMRKDKRNEFIESYANNNVYAVFNSSRQKGSLSWSCSTEDKKLVADLNLDKYATNKSNNAVYKTMRLALSCTAEYSNYFGATSSAQSALVIAAFNATLTRVNGVYGIDLALKLLLIPQTTNVIYYAAATDPYSAVTSGNAPAAWNVELQNTLNTSLTGAATTLAANNLVYDIGHLFGASGGGGNAGCIGCVCVNPSANGQKQKGSGYTSPGNSIPSGDTFDIDYVAHEMGHQVGGNHTFSHSYENNAVNVEPGSGSTIMAYAGITGSTDVQGNSDDYFAYRSILQIQTNLATKSCPVTTAITHGTPLVTAGTNRTIPKGTPFVLTGSATDSGGGTLTYCWEENDDMTTTLVPADPVNPTAAEDAQVALESFPSATKIDGPNFRSYKPVLGGSRYFPNLQSLASGVTPVWEVLSDVARTLAFTLTVRDNVANGGQTGTGSLVVTVDDTKGPLTVTSQSATSIVYPTGSTQTVTWSVNATNTSPGGTNVDILLSIDGGLTYPYTLLTATPNDGTQAVTLPAAASGAYCRFMVKANGNIFFNINSKAFAVGNYTYQTVNTCTDYVINFGNIAIPESSTSYSGFTTTVTDAYTVTDANVKVELTHGNIGTLRIGIIPPGAPAASGVQAIFNGGRATTADVVCTTANLNTLFDAEAAAAFTCANSNSNSTLKPPTLSTVFPTPLSTNINGLTSSGSWKFYITDIATTDGVTGTMQRAVFNLCQSTLSPVLSTESYDFEDFSLFPNPNNGEFTLKFKSASTNDIKINVHDMRGRQVYEKSFSNTGAFNQNINLEKVQSGIYLVSISDGNTKTVKRIVVQ